MNLEQLPILKLFSTSKKEFEAALKARAKAGHLNIHRTFDIESHVLHLERKGDLRTHFAKLAAGLPVTNKHIDVRR